MSRSASKRWFTIVRSPFFTLGLTITGVLLCAFGFLLLAGYYTKLAFSHLKQGEFVQAQKYSSASLPIINTFNTITFKLIPDLVVWNEALNLASQADILVSDIIKISEQSLTTDSRISLETLSPTVARFHTSLYRIHSTVPKTIYVKKYVTPEISQQLEFGVTALKDVQTLLSSLSEGKQTWVILLQNSDEVRATGGFPGSYILLHFDSGILTELVVEDIYDADGQFNGYIAAPPGIREYTSGDRGLRLPDANWWPDFPTSAQTMLQFFALGEKSNIAGVVAINLDTAKSILEITGPLWLPDYNVTVNQENVGEVLRAERSEFFPGSSQKKHLLQLTIAQLKQKFSELNTQQQRQLAESLYAKIKQKELQFFSTKPILQDLFYEYQLAGALDITAIKANKIIENCQCTPTQIALVESNVGINKVNKYVSREHSLHFDNNQLTITTVFTNNAAPLSTTELTAFLDQPVETQPRNGNGYLNYYRLLVSPHYTVSDISIANVPINTWDEEIITTAGGQELKQVGVLVGIPERSNNTVTFRLSSSTKPEAILFYKQSGIPPTTVKISAPSLHTETLVNSDTVFEL